MDEQNFLRAHQHSSFHREEILASPLCGCSYCLEIFTATEITDWVDPGKATALCPKCGVDAILGDNSGFPVTAEFLAGMRAFWFSRMAAPKRQL